MPALAVLAVVGIAGSIYGGIAANNAAQKEASLQKEQGDIALSEAQVNAKNEAFNQTQTVQRQRLAYLANGVTTEGSPSAVLESSKAYGQSMVDSIMNRGKAQMKLAYEGATITQDKGRSALIGGFLQAGSSAASTVTKAYSAGYLDGPSTTDASSGTGLEGR